MRVKRRLTRELCPASGKRIPASAEDATFRLVRCPSCARQNLQAVTVHAVGSEYEVTLPPHRARAAVGKAVSRGGKPIQAREPA